MTDFKFGFSGTPYRVFGIVWENPASNLPHEAVLDLPSWLTDMGYEDCEADDFEEPEFDDDDDQDDFWDNYEPSDAAEAELENQWQSVIREKLEAKFGEKVASIGGFEPHVGPLKITLHLRDSGTDEREGQHASV